MKMRYNISMTEKIIAINFFIFLISLLFQSLILNFGLIPEKVLNGEVWRLVTSMFLHENILHILMNMLALYFFGSILESRVGRIKFLVIYLFGGIIGGFVFILFSFFPLSLIPALGVSYYSNGIGASGAIFAIGTLLALMIPNLRVGFLFIPIQTTLFYSIILWFIILAIISLFSGHIGNSAHLGGIIAGVIVAKFINRKGYQEQYL